ncbi:MAG: hypothetical protein U0625_06705 [Phycisphaerales bacterium]
MIAVVALASAGATRTWAQAPATTSPAATPATGAITPPAAVSRAPRGAVGSFEIPDPPAANGVRLRAKPMGDVAAPVIVRITPLPGDRARVDYLGIVSGSYDLAPLVERADGRPAEALPPMTVEIFTQLPPGHGTDVFGDAAPEFGFAAHYGLLLGAVAALWLAVPAVILVRRAMRRAPAPPPAPAPRAPTPRELLLELVHQARERELTLAERSRAELLLLQALRPGHAETPADLAGAIAALRADPRTADAVAAVERWLHAPRGGDPSAAIAAIEASAQTAGATADATQEPRP